MKNVNAGGKCLFNQHTDNEILVVYCCPIDVF